MNYGHFISFLHHCETVKILRLNFNPNATNRPHFKSLIFLSFMLDLLYLPNMRAQIIYIHNERPLRKKLTKVIDQIG
jgi:hypothetical protein